MAAMLLAGPWGILGSHQLRAAEVTVIDGDTLLIDGEVIQLYGIDAPELGQLCDTDGVWQPCGVDAALALGKLLTMAAESLYCTPWDDGRERVGEARATVAVCESGSEDLGLVMLHRGYGVALPGSFPGYPHAQEEAREGGLGLWHSKFVVPWQWRQDQRLPGEPTDCNVKAVTGDDGQRVYYVPTDPQYDGIATDLARGDALFCTDEEARLAGSRRPGEARPAD